jgi:hydroxymethylpyrimidine pyrophosphatase-like HAD family hydrolase
VTSPLAGNKNAISKRPFWSAVTQVLIEKKGVDKVDALKEIAKKLIEAAQAGEQWAIKELADRLDGRAAQQLIHTGDPQNPVVIQATSHDENL